MATSSQLKDFEILFSHCFENTTTLISYTRTLLLDGTILWHQINTDGSTVLLTSAPGGVTPCLPVTKDTEILTLCDVVGGVPTPFLRKFTWGGDHTVAPSFSDYTFSGVAYTPLGVVGQCSLDAVIQPTMFSAVATNASPVTIPANVKSLHVLNLGSITNPFITSDIDISGGLVETMLAVEESFEYSVQEDQDSFLNASIVVTPASGYQAKVRWTI